MGVAGLVLAAGAGRRYGGPKALVAYGGRLLVQRAAATLRQAGCARTVVVLGAAADLVRAAAPDLPEVVVNPDWPSGMGSSLRLGLAALAAEPAPTGAGAAPNADQPGAPHTDQPDAPHTDQPSAPHTDQPGAPAALTASEPVEAAVVLLVDMPAVTPEAVRRVTALASPDALVMGGYGGRRSHPVLLGRQHWAGVADLATGDRGARDYLRAHAGLVRVVPVGDVAADFDLDEPATGRA